MLGSSLPPVVCRRAHVLVTMLGSSLPPVVCRRAHVLVTMLGSSLPPVVCIIYVCCVFVCVQWCPVHIVFLFCFSSSCLPDVASFTRLSIFDCPFSIL